MQKESVLAINLRSRMVINMPTNQALSCFHCVVLWISPYLGAFFKQLVRTDLLISATVEIFLIMHIDFNRVYLPILVFQESNDDMEDLHYIFCLFPGYDDSRFCFVRHTFLLCKWISVSSYMYTRPQPALFLRKKKSIILFPNLPNEWCFHYDKGIKIAPFIW